MTDESQLIEDKEEEKMYIDLKEKEKRDKSRTFSIKRGVGRREWIRLSQIIYEICKRKKETLYTKDSKMTK